MRLRTLGASYVLARLKHGTRLWLEDISPADWAEHTEFLLGEDVHQMPLPESVCGRLGPDKLWGLVLSYEFQIRKEAIRLVLMERRKLTDALKEVRRCSETRSKYWVAPLTLEIAVVAGPSRQLRERIPSPADPSQGPTKWQRRKGKGKEKGKREGPTWHSQLPDGKKPCYAWNDSPSKCSGRCNFTHACRICFSKDHHAAGCPERVPGQGSQTPPS